MSEREGAHSGFLISQRDEDQGGRELSSEEDDLLGRNIKRMQDVGSNSQVATEKRDVGKEDVVMEEPPQKDIPSPNSAPRREDNNPIKTSISYKAKLTGEAEGSFEKDFDKQLEEWLKEEEDITPIMSDEEKSLLNDLPSIRMPDERLKEACRPWKDTLILTLLGRKTNVNMMKDRICWLLKSENFELIDVPNNFYLFRSRDKALCSKLLFDGPWVIQGHYLAVQRWSPNFNSYCNQVNKVAVWIRVPNLPMYAYSEECMLELGNLIGRALKVDLNTLAHRGQNSTVVERGKFAQVSVEVDLNKKLQSRFVLRKKIYTVEYEGLNTICFKCGMYGHNQEACNLNGAAQDMASTSSAANDKQPPENQKQETAREGKHTLVSVPGIAVDEQYGAWMQVRASPRHRFPKAEPHKSQQDRGAGGVAGAVKEKARNKGSRFDILQDQDLEPQSNEAVNIHKNGEPSLQWRRKDKRNPCQMGERETATTRGKVEGARLERTKLTADAKRQDKGKGADREKDADRLQRTRNGIEPASHEGKDVVFEFGTNGPSPSVDPVEENKKRSKKRAPITRPKIISPLMKKKQVGRTHRVVFGSLAKNGQLLSNQDPPGAIIAKDIKLDIDNPTSSVLVPGDDAMETGLQSADVQTTNSEPRSEHSDSTRGRDFSEQNDLWFETQDEVREELQCEAELVELSDSGQ